MSLRFRRFTVLSNANISNGPHNHDYKLAETGAASGMPLVLSAFLYTGTVNGTTGNIVMYFMPGIVDSGGTLRIASNESGIQRTITTPLSGYTYTASWNTLYNGDDLVGDGFRIRVDCQGDRSLTGADLVVFMAFDT